MSYLDWIRRCNTHDLSQFIPFEIANQKVGWIKQQHVELLSEFTGVFQIEAQCVTLPSRLDSLESRTEAMATVLEDRRLQPLLSGWYHELYPVSSSFQTPPLMLLERAAVSLFGVLSYGIHLNGYSYQDGHLHMWVARRSYDRTTYPGRLDNLVAGGKSYDLTAWETMIKESQEEANIDPDLARNARAVGAFNYNRGVKRGIRRDVIYNYDLELPVDFKPENTDGEVDEFYLWPIEQVMDTVANTQEFKDNCNLVIIDFLIRHGWITPETPHYLELQQTLHPPVV